MPTILVPTDFSKCANNALMYALEIAQRTGRSITVLYVVYPNEGVDNNMYDAFFVDTYVNERIDSMKKWVKKFTKIWIIGKVQPARIQDLAFMQSKIGALLG